jgi:hypothetical protein
MISNRMSFATIESESKDVDKGMSAVDDIDKSATRVKH